MLEIEATLTLVMEDGAGFEFLADAFPHKV